LSLQATFNASLKDCFYITVALSKNLGSYQVRASILSIEWLPRPLLKVTSRGYCFSRVTITPPEDQVKYYVWFQTRFSLALWHVRLEMRRDSTLDSFCGLEMTEAKRAELKWRWGRWEFHISSTLYSTLIFPGYSNYFKLDWTTYKGRQIQLRAQGRDRKGERSN